MKSSTQFKKILVPLDGSALSEWAIEPALLIGRRSHSEIVLVRAPSIDLNLVVAPNHSSDRAHAELHTYLNSLPLTYASPDIQLHAQIIEGDPASAIVDLALLEHFDLSVMSTHGYSGITRWMLGSVTEKVLRSAPCSMLIIRSLSPELN
jgi:nucleotide-binding universal stress UspA family protein